MLNSILRFTFMLGARLGVLLGLYLLLAGRWRILLGFLFVLC